MISFEKALDKVITHASIIPLVEKSIYQIDSDVLAEDIKPKVSLLVTGSESVKPGQKFIGKCIMPKKGVFTKVLKGGDWPRWHVS